jgi:catechol 2,3-dioxygenase-like lactoylglutathione lyase family enzyme
MFTPSSESANPVAFEGVTPILRVRDLSASLEYYVAKLGFKINWQTLWFASVSRGRCAIFLSQGDQGHPGSWVWVSIEDAGALFREYQASGALLRNPPTNYSWAYEFQVQDLDGNVLRMGSAQKSGEPEGEWLDMNGDRWALSSTGEWVRATKA